MGKPFFAEALRGNSLFSKSIDRKSKRAAALRRATAPVVESLEKRQLLSNVLLSGSYLGAYPDQTPDRIPSAAFDGSTGTIYQYSSANGGWVGLDLGAGNAKSISRIRYYTSNNSSYVVGAIFQGSNNQTSWSNLTATISTGTNGWNEVTVTDSTNAYRYLRYLAPTTGNGYSIISEVEFYTSNGSSAPAAPSNLTATASGSSSVNLAWYDNANNETGYQVERKEEVLGTWSVLASNLAANTTSYNDSTGLQAARTYFYRVRALDAAGDWVYSPQVSVTMSGNLTKLTGSPFGKNPTQTADRQPEAASDGNVATIYQCIDATGGYTGIDLGFGNAQKLYKVRYYGSTPANLTGAVIQGLNDLNTWDNLYSVSSPVAAGWNEGFVDASSTAYRYLRYYGPSTGSTYSMVNELEFYTLNSDSPPAAAGNLTANVTGLQQVVLSWADNATNETGYRVERKLGLGGAWTPLATLSPDSGSYVDDDSQLTPNRTYSYRVRTLDTAGDWIYSAEASVQMPGTLTKLTGTAIGTAGTSGTTGPDKATDNNTSTSYLASLTNGGWAGIDLGANNAASVYKIRFYPYGSSVKLLAGGVFQGSNDQSAWTTLTTVSSQPLNGWNDVYIAPSQPFRYLRFMAAANIRTTISEMEFYRVSAAAISGPTHVASGTPFSLNLSFQGAEVVQSWDIDWGDGSATQHEPGNPPTVGHRFTGSDLNRTITATCNTSGGPFMAQPLVVRVDGIQTGLMKAWLTRIAKLNTAGSASSPPQDITPFGTGAFFSADDGSGSGQQLWWAEGAPGNETATKITGSGTAQPLYITTVGQTVFYTSPTGANGVRQLWRIDGPASTPQLVTTSISSPQEFAILDDQLLFSGVDGTGARQLWTCDPASGTTQKVLDSNNQPVADPLRFHRMTVNGGDLSYFTATTAGGDRELWVTDLTTSGTHRVANLNASSSADPQNLFHIGSTLFFSADDGVHGRELWKLLTPTSAPSRVTLSGGGRLSLSGGTSMASVNGELYFVANDGAHGREPCRFDAASGYAVALPEVRAGSEGSQPTNLTAHGGKLLFVAADTTGNNELYSYDPQTNAYTKIEIRPGASGSNPSQLVSNGQLTFFIADDGASGRELWMTDGATAARVADFNATGSSDPSELRLIDGELYVFFTPATSSGRYELWKVQDTQLAPVSIEPSAPLAEGTTVYLDGVVTNPLPDVTYSYSWTLTQGQTQLAIFEGQQFDFTPAENGQFTVALTVESSLGLVGSATSQLEIANLPPDVTITGPIQIAPGTQAVFSALAEDPAGANDPLSYNWSVTKDGEAYALPSGVVTDQADFAFTPADLGDYIVSVTVADDDGGITPASQDLYVGLHRPTGLTATRTDSTVDLSWNDTNGSEDGFQLQEATAADFAGGVTTTLDPGTISYSDSNTLDGLTHYYRVRAHSDTLGDSAWSETVSVVLPPASQGQQTIVISGDATVDEGSALTISIDTSAADLSQADGLLINWGDGNIESADLATESAQHIYADGPASHSVSVSAQSGTVLNTSNTLALAVLNVAPVVSAPSALFVEVGSTFNLQLAIATDPGFDAGQNVETLSATIDWGDGSDPAPATIQVSPGAAGEPTTALIKGYHSYQTAGSYTLAVTVTDDDLGSTTKEIVVTAGLMQAMQAPGVVGETATVDLARISGLNTALFQNELGVFQVDDAYASGEVQAEGVIYLRADKAGTLKPYVGQSESWARYIARQSEHIRAFPDADFDFTILQRTKPGLSLDVAEESWIRQLGGPTNKSNPAGLLSNKRYQMNDLRYRANGGTMDYPN